MNKGILFFSILISGTLNFIYLVIELYLFLTNVKLNENLPFNQINLEKNFNKNVRTIPLKKYNRKNLSLNKIIKISTPFIQNITSKIYP
jgi:hypothetical protein